jgi:hypothetical protein
MEHLQPLYVVAGHHSEEMIILHQTTNGLSDAQKQVFTWSIQVKEKARRIC